MEEAVTEMTHLGETEISRESEDHSNHSRFGTSGAGGAGGGPSSGDGGRRVTTLSRPLVVRQLA
eukprot:987951-Amphidinium_carterae.1